MTIQAQAFRRIASQACSTRNQFRDFMASGLEDILDEANTSGWSAQEIAVEILGRCCVEDGRFNNQQKRFLAVITYLNEQRGRLGQGEQQAFADLLTILNSGGTIKAIQGWMATHFP